MPIWNVHTPSGRVFQMNAEAEYVDAQSDYRGDRTGHAADERERLMKSIELALEKALGAGYEVGISSRMSFYPMNAWTARAWKLSPTGRRSRNASAYRVVPPMHKFYDLSVEDVEEGDRFSASWKIMNMSPGIWIQPEVFDEKGVIFQGNFDCAVPHGIALDLTHAEGRDAITRDYPGVMVALDSFLQHRRADPRFLPRQ